MTSALLLVDLQNDFIHPDGAYARGGAVSADARRLPGLLAPLAKRMRAAGSPILASCFTLVPDASGQPMIDDHLRRLRPFLGRGDFAPGSWGHQVVNELGTIDATVEKIAYSAFQIGRAHV